MSDELRLTRITYDSAPPSGRRLFMCRHTGSRPDRTLADVTASHDLDLRFQEKYGLRWLSYFLDRDNGKSFCLAEAPSKEAVQACHLEAHGQMVPYRVIEVEWSMVEAFLGDIAEPGPGQGWNSTALRTVLFARAANTASLALSLGDSGALRLLKAAQEVVHSAVRESRGSNIRADVDSLLACFTSASRAVECAIALHRRLSAFNSAAPASVDIRVGLNAGEPVSETGELFGAAVHLAQEACHQAPAPAAIVVTEVVRELCMGKGSLSMLRVLSMYRARSR